MPGQELAALPTAEDQDFEPFWLRHARPLPFGNSGGQHLYADGGSCSALIFASLRRSPASERAHPGLNQLFGVMAVPDQVQGRGMTRERGRSVFKEMRRAA